MEKKRVYISGPMTGLTQEEINEKFEAAEEHINGLGYYAVNPAKIAVIPLDYEQYMKIDLKLLAFCDAIHMLPGWERSQGARREMAEALRLGLEII